MAKGSQYDDYANRTSHFGVPNNRESRGVDRPGSPRVGAPAVMNYFRKVVGPASKGKRCTVVESPVVVAANVKWLRENRGVEPTDLFPLIDEFAKRVASGRVAVSGKSAWRVFMKTWHTLGSTASGSLSQAMQASDDGDDPWKL